MNLLRVKKQVKIKAKRQCTVSEVGPILHLLESLLVINLPRQEESIFVPDRVDKCGKHQPYILKSIWNISQSKPGSSQHTKCKQVTTSVETNYINEFQGTNKNYRRERQKERKLIKGKWAQLDLRKIFSNEKGLWDVKGTS